MLGHRVPSFRIGCPHCSPMQVPDLGIIFRPDDAALQRAVIPQEDHSRAVRAMLDSVWGYVRHHRHPCVNNHDPAQFRSA